MEIQWATIPEFPNYMISNCGDVINKDSGRPIRATHNPQGALKVGLVSGSQQSTRSLKLLVARCFVEGEDDIHDTPIQLDGIQDNVWFENLRWRPRWFALEYTKQLRDVSDNDLLGPIIDNHGNIYMTVYEAGVVNGLLFRDIRKSIIMHETVFPTFQIFEFVK